MELNSKAEEETKQVTHLRYRPLGKLSIMMSSSRNLDAHYYTRTHSEVWDYYWTLSPFPLKERPLLHSWRFLSNPRPIFSGQAILYLHWKRTFQLQPTHKTYHPIYVYQILAGCFWCPCSYTDYWWWKVFINTHHGIRHLKKISHRKH